MIIRKRTLLFISLLTASALISCKKDETETLPYLDGSVRVDFEPALPAYIRANDNTVYTMVPHGASHPDGLEVGYRWKVSPGESSSYQESEEADGSFKYNFAEYNKDTLRTITVICEAFADGYTPLSASYSVIVVNSGEKGSIQRAGYDFSGSYVELDGIRYLTYEAPDGNIWMQQNLAYDGEGDDALTGAPYVEAEAMSDVFGRYYTWNEATGNKSDNDGSPVQGICPDGWHIPSDEEWTALANATMREKYPDWTDMPSDKDWSQYEAKISREFMAGELLDPEIPDTDEDYDSDINYGKEARSATFNSEILWEYFSNVGDPTNRSGISAIPAGYARYTDGFWNFSGAFEYAIFWTSTEDATNGNKAVCRVINNESQVVYRDAHDKSTFAASVRCVKNK